MASTVSGEVSRPSAFATASRRTTALVTAWLLGLSAVAWLYTVRQASSMSGMVSGLAQVGRRMPNDMAIPVFLAMWVGMMVAMMFPTVAPMVLTHRAIARRRGDGMLSTVAFGAGYLAVWSAIGVVPLAAFLGFRNLAENAATSRWLPTLAGAILAGSGLYQFTRWKTTCLKACRSPIQFVLTHDFGGGARSAARAGVSHGAFCMGCCWALMGVLVVVGLMNLPWMGVLTLVFLAEKNWHHGVGLSRVAGIALVALGLAVIAHPSLLGSLSGPAAGAMTMGP